MLKYDEFVERLQSRGVPSSLIKIVIDELLKGIDIDFKGVSLEIESGPVKIKSLIKESTCRCNYIIEVDGKELSIMKYISNFKVSDFDTRSSELTELSITMIPFDFKI